MKKIVLEIEGSSTRLDLALLRELRKEHPALSRAQVKLLIQEGAVLHRGHPATPSSILPSGRHEITLLREDLASLETPLALASPRGSFLPVIYEDAELLVLHKASGIPSVPHRPEDVSSAVSSALAHLPSLAQENWDSERGLEPGLLHRLDTGTSGILVFAKTPDEWRRLRQAWRKGEVRKLYRAVVSPRAPGASRLRVPKRIELRLAHSARSAKRMVAIPPSGPMPEIRGKPLPAITHLLALAPAGGERLDLQIEIETGVMHQIRCHLAAMEWPILGDPLYGATDSNRLWLHAWRLTLPLRDHTRLTLEANVPGDWPSEGRLPQR